MTVGEMVNLNDSEIKTEIDAAMSRLKKINEEVNNVENEAADCECAYFKQPEDGAPAECELMTNLYCKTGQCPLTRDATDTGQKS